MANRRQGALLVLCGWLLRENKEKRQEEPFLSLRLMHGEEAHIALALAKAVSESRNPER